MCCESQWTHGQRDTETGGRPPHVASLKPEVLARGGFSFLEVMVVVVIIGLLAGAVAINVRSRVDKARVNRARSDIATIVNALETYYAEHGKYPSNEQGLQVLDLKGSSDPWGRPYVYNQPGRKGPFEVLCYGADGQEGGDGADKDVSSDDLSSADAQTAIR